MWQVARSSFQQRARSMRLKSAASSDRSNIDAATLRSINQKDQEVPLNPPAAVVLFRNRTVRYVMIPGKIRAVNQAEKQARKCEVRRNSSRPNTDIDCCIFTKRPYASNVECERHTFTSVTAWLSHSTYNLASILSALRRLQ